MIQPTAPLFSAIVVAAILGASGPAAAATTIRLWPGKAPGEQGVIEPEKADLSPNDPGIVTRVTNVSEPTLMVFPAPADKRTGAALIIAPGGGYRFLSWAHEGEDVARWFNGVGVTAFVLKYRVPTRSFDPGNRLALMDAQRAVSLVRSRAKDWNLDPARVGFLGFSAGGHLGANLEGNYEPRAYDAVDDADHAPCRPDFVVLIYPGALVAEEDSSHSSHLAPELHISAHTPPTFVAVAADDKGCADGSIRYFQALKGAGVKSELHVYASGGHGFGIRPRAGAAATWPARCADWMRTIGILPVGGS